MEQNSTYEQEIDLKDLMFAVLYRWRPIIAVALVLAVLMGGYRAFTTYRSQSDAEAVKKAQEAYDEAVLSYEKNLANCEKEISNLKSSIEEQQNYLDQSVLMRMSPYDVWEAKTVMFVRTDYKIMPDMVYQNLNYTDTILEIYRTSLLNLEFMKTVAESEGLEERFLEELVTVTAANNLLTIRVRGENEDRVKGIMNLMLEGLETTKQQIISGIGNHTISEVSSSLGSLVELSLLDTQKSQNDRLTTLNDSLTAKQKALEDMTAPTMPSPSVVAAVKSGVKYAVLGGVLGAFMVVFFVCVAFLMSDKLYSAKELKNRYRVKILGTLPCGDGKKPFFVDAWLRRMEGRSGSKDADTEYGLIAANINNYSGDIKNILVAGTAGDEQISKVADSLSGKFSGVKISAGGNLLRDEKTLRSLPDCDGVVFVEKCQVSHYNDVGLELEKTRDMGKPVIGCVVFE